MERSRFEMIREKLKLFLPLILCALAGYLYYYFIGCNGSCAISGSPVNSTIYGAFVGLVLTDWKKIKLLLKRKG